MASCCDWCRWERNQFVSQCGQTLYHCSNSIDDGGDGCYERDDRYESDDDYGDDDNDGDDDDDDDDGGGDDDDIIPLKEFSFPWFGMCI